MTLFGYHGKILRVDLTNQRLSTTELSADDAKNYVGGTGLGAKILYDEVPPNTPWDSPANRVILGTGPMNGAPVMGSGTFTVVTKGPMTNLAVNTQASGYFGAYLKMSGLDGIVVYGQAEEWCYLKVDNGQFQLRNAKHLVGRDTWETEELVKKDLESEKSTPSSVFSIGPAGEKLVRYSALVGDRGHVASKGGVGAVLGSKRLKALVAVRGNQTTPICDMESLTKATSDLYQAVMDKPFTKTIKDYGVSGVFVDYGKAGLLPVKNYTTSVFPEELAEKLSGQYMRSHFEHKKKTCWLCRIGHNAMVKVTEGPYQGTVGEEPEYEPVAAFGSQIGQTDAGAAVMLSNLVDRLGLDANECGWVLGLVMECFERGILKKEDLDGLEMRWGDAEAVKNLLIKIASREGVGDLLAEGTKRSAQRIGGEALNIGVYTGKGATPRGHDHRSRWIELLDVCTSDTSTIMATGGAPNKTTLGFGKVDVFSPEDVATSNAQFSGWQVFGDSLVICNFAAAGQHGPLINVVNAITGWSLTLNDVLKTGKRTMNLLRAFDMLNGLDPATEKPSPRYGSTPKDGPAAGIGIMKHFDKMARIYRREMGWDEETGKPLPQTLKSYGLDNVAKDLW